MEEIWKPVLGYEDHYQISDLGRLRRISRSQATRPGRIKKPYPTISGYLRYNLSVGNKVRHISVHRLVLEAFHGPIPEYLQTNHKNGNKKDNRLINLEVCTPSYNRVHALEVLKVKVSGNPYIKGTDNPKAKIGESEVRKIRRLYDSGELSQQAIADQFGLTQTTVSRIVLRQLWAHISD